MENDLVIFSRAGDTFHYRWAARRCLKLLYPKSQLTHVIIEGSKEREIAGEYVIDFAEYSTTINQDIINVHYFQLKHSTKRVNDAFTLSELKDTIVGFASRFSEMSCKIDKPQLKLKFSIISNRKITDEFKCGIISVATGNATNGRFLATLKKYTALDGIDLQRFCSSLELIDGEGDYNVQKHELHAEIALLVAGGVDPAQVEHVVALVSDPDNWHRKIVCEDILKRFGGVSAHELFPAPPEFDQLEFTIKREQHEDIVAEISQASAPIIIHASGGVGKSVFARQLADSLPSGSVGIVYDCFGSGKYRNRSEPRHRHRDALVQIANQIASFGLCEPLIPTASPDDAFIRSFLTRLKTAASSIQRINPAALLAVLIDAADNAEMAAKEFNEPCFAHQLIRETVPDGCRIVALCRTERVDLLSPTSAVLQLKLNNFSEDETLVHLRAFFPKATKADGVEFYRLTGGNPRVQANALNMNRNSIAELFCSLGPAGTTVDDQISGQLSSAITAIKEKLPGDFQHHIDTICLGLANLPPLIPLKVLATAATVDIAEVKSFVADLGRPLWLSDDSVQFRDEPTETWFRENFSASARQVESFLVRLKPLTSSFSYVAEAYPSLLLQAEKYEELISLALTDDFLPDNSPIDKRNIMVFRLQFAFKAALKNKRYADAAKLAFRAGEEVAGDKRQLLLLRRNVDLIAPLQSEQRVQELAFRRTLGSGWEGSENAYSAALLSTVKDYKGEARGYLRAADNWLRLYFEERKKQKDNWHHEALQDEDIVEFAFARYNLFGSRETVDFILSWQPSEVIFRVTRLLIRRFIDSGNFTGIEEICEQGKHNTYLVIAIADELITVGTFPPIQVLHHNLILLTHNRTRIGKQPPHSFEDKITPAILSFAEACAASKLRPERILRLLRYYMPQTASNLITYEHDDKDRRLFLRAVSLKAVLTGNLAPDIEQFMPKETAGNKKTYQKEQDEKEYRQVVGGMLPWYIVRSRSITRDLDNFEAIVEAADQQSKKARAQRWKEYDRLLYEISRIRFEALAYANNLTEPEVSAFVKSLIGANNKFWLADQLSAVRTAYRLKHLHRVRNQLELSCREIMASTSDEGPESKAGYYISLARAVLPVSQADAAAFFDYAVEAVSKFGDEIVERWDAVVSMAERCTEGSRVEPELTYRYIRCAELVGENVAREKYFARNWAVRICARLSTQSAFAALSRWRDRDVGWIDRQLPALMHEVVETGFIPPSVAWSMSAFSWEDGVEEYAILCIKKETDLHLKQLILDSAIKALRLKEISENCCRTLKDLANESSLKSEQLDEIIAYYDNSPPSNIKSEETYVTKHKEQKSSVDWDAFFGDVDLTDPTLLSNAIGRFDESDTPRYPEHFWREVFKRVTDDKALSMLESVAEAERADFYDIINALKNLPAMWRQKPSVVRGWQKILSILARRLAFVLTTHNGFDYFAEQANLDNASKKAIREGVIEGLASTGSFADAENFFGFLNILSPLLSTEEATALLDYGLARFEEHIEDDFADGPWTSRLMPPKEIKAAFTGYIWSALGSPRSTTRWEAAHCVRILADIGRADYIESLIAWMQKDTVDAFGSKDFPFYSLHARLYLLIALARIAIDHPQILVAHSSLFSDLALKSSHALIQKFAADLALSIEKMFSRTYNANTVKELKHVGVSAFPVHKIDYAVKLQSPWHTTGKVDKSLDLRFGYDFDRYWFEPLGDVFGISGEQVEELAREVVFKDWKWNISDKYIHDPRERLWRSHRHERETWHDHSSYPRTDNFNFYISYHALFTVAAKLLNAMPVVSRYDYSENEWADWLQRHLLTRSDGRWVADRRDPAPLERRVLTPEGKRDDWRKNVVEEDFLDGLIFRRHGQTWLNVAGYCTDTESEFEETFYFASALVSRELSDSLLNALSTCKESTYYKLPDYQEERAEFDIPPFKLTGWLHRESHDRSLDEYDPHASKIQYSPYFVGEKYIDAFGMHTDLENREWRLPDTSEPSIINEIWCTAHDEQRESPSRHGNQMSASLCFLKKLCADLQCNLILKVQIDHRIRRSYYSGSDDDTGYKPPFSRVYIFTAEGGLRGTKKHYQLR